MSKSEEGNKKEQANEFNFKRLKETNYIVAKYLQCEKI